MSRRPRGHECAAPDLCAECAAQQALNAEDWQILRFYSRVKQQLVELTGKLYPRAEGWESVLRIYGYPPPTWGALVAGATMLHALVYEDDRVEWVAETGRLYSEVEVGDFRDDSG